MIKIREILKKLKQNKFKIISQKGSHVKLKKEDKMVVVSVHDGMGGTLPRKTLKRIEEQSGIYLGSK